MIRTILALWHEYICKLVHKPLPTTPHHSLAPTSRSTPQHPRPLRPNLSSHSTADPMINPSPILNPSAGLKQIYTSPDIYLIDDMLTPEECDSIISQASKKEMKVQI